MRPVPLLVPFLLLGACATVPRTPVAPPLVEVQILGLNDVHGNLQPSGPVSYADSRGRQVTAALQGGVARLATLLKTVRTTRSITVAAGDLIGATPIESAYFLDEPTVKAMGMVGLDLASVGNHEFDKGSAELLRMQNGGCARVSTIPSRLPCRLERFAGARFHYLAANVRTRDGRTLFPATALRRFGPVTIGFIGMTLKDTGTLVSPAGTAGLTFADEAATANALVPSLKAQGADTIVLLIHQGGKVEGTYRQADCAGLDGAILPILDALSPDIRTIVSGHTHNAYACSIARGGVRRLLTSAGKNGYFATDLRLRFDPRSRQLVDSAATNLPVAADNIEQPDIARLVARYVAASRPAAERIVGRLSAPVEFHEGGDETPVADLIADAQFAATRPSARGGAQLSFINASGVRSSIVPGPNGAITYGQIFTLQPFGNTLVVRSFTGAQLQAVLEQQVRDSDGAARVGVLLVPSANARMTIDPSAPAGRRVSLTIDGQALDPRRTYRVSINNFLASGGDGFSALADGTDTVDAGLDLDATEAWLATNPTPPVANRITVVAP